MDARVTIEVDLKNMCDKESLLIENLTFEQMIRMLIREEGLIGLCDPEDLIIIKVEEINAPSH